MGFDDSDLTFEWLATSNWEHFLYKIVIASSLKSLTLVLTKELALGGEAVGGPFKWRSKADARLPEDPKSQVSLFVVLDR